MYLTWQLKLGFSRLHGASETEDKAQGLVEEGSLKLEPQRALVSV